MPDIVLTIGSDGDIEFTQEKIDDVNTWVDGKTLVSGTASQEVNAKPVYKIDIFFDTSKKYVA